MAKLKLEMNPSAQAKMAKFKEEADKQLEQQIKIEREKSESKMRKAIDEESRQRIKESREEAEERLRVAADARIKQETGRLQKQAEKQLKERIEEFEQRQRDEQGLKDAGYDPRDGQRSATIALCVAV
jgi:hypothetical protein